MGEQKIGRGHFSGLADTLFGGKKISKADFYQADVSNLFSARQLLLQSYSLFRPVWSQNDKNGCTEKTLETFSWQKCASLSGGKCKIQRLRKNTHKCRRIMGNVWGVFALAPMWLKNVATWLSWLALDNKHLFYLLLLKSANFCCRLSFFFGFYFFIVLSHSFMCLIYFILLLFYCKGVHHLLSMISLQHGLLKLYARKVVIAPRAICIAATILSILKRLQIRKSF